MSQPWSQTSPTVYGDVHPSAFAALSQLLVSSASQVTGKGLPSAWQQRAVQWISSAGSQGQQRNSQSGRCGTKRKATAEESRPLQSRSLQRPSHQPDSEISSDGAGSSSSSADQTTQQDTVTLQSPNAQADEQHDASVTQQSAQQT